MSLIQSLAAVLLAGGLPTIPPEVDTMLVMSTAASEGGRLLVPSPPRTEGGLPETSSESITFVLGVRRP